VQPSRPDRIERSERRSVEKNRRDGPETERGERSDADSGRTDGKDVDERRVQHWTRNEAVNQSQPDDTRPVGDTSELAQGAVHEPIDREPRNRKLVKDASVSADNGTDPVADNEHAEDDAD